MFIIKQNNLNPRPCIVFPTITPPLQLTYPFDMTFHPDSLPNLTGKVFIVTGGNSGM
jgi:hypothetical protein